MAKEERKDMAAEELMEKRMSEDELDEVAGGSWAETATLTDYILANGTKMGGRSEIIKAYGAKVRSPQGDEKFLTRYLKDCGIRCVCDVNKGNTYTVEATGKMVDHRLVYKYLQDKGYARGGNGAFLPDED